MRQRRLEIEHAPGRVRIVRPGTIPKLVPQVRHITFSGDRARADRQQVLYVTERAVFALEPDGLRLIEVPEGIDLQADVLDRMPFPVAVDAALQRRFPGA